MSDLTNNTRQFCEMCHIGSLQPFRTAYARWHAGVFVIMPGMPAWRCDYCGDTFYDDDALQRLTLLLGPESRSHGKKRWPTSGVEENTDPGLGDRRRF